MSREEVGEDGQLFFMNSSSPEWGYSGGANIPEFEDNFNSYDNIDTWTEILITGGNGTIAAASGVLTMDGGTVDNKGVQLRLAESTSQILRKAKRITFEARMRINQISAGADNFMFGLGNGTLPEGDLPQTTYIQFESSSTDINTVRAKVKGVTAVIIAQTENVWTTFKIKIEDGPTPKVEFFIDNVLKETLFGVPSWRSLDFYTFWNIFNHTNDNPKLEISWVKLSIG